MRWKKADILILTALGAVCLLLFFLAASCFDTARRAAELWPWLISEAEPGAEGAMNTLEEQRFRWMLAGALSLLLGLSVMAVGAWIWRRRRKR